MPGRQLGHVKRPCQVEEQILRGAQEGNTASCQEVAAGRSSPLKEEIGQLQPGQL